MARYPGEWVKDPEPELVFNAAEFWRDRCLLDNRSLFTDKELWTTENFTKHLQKYFIEELDTGDKNFFDKLENQLKHAPSETKQLVAEIFWVMMIVPLTTNISLSKKVENIQNIWNWSGEPLPKEKLNSRNLIDCLKPGIASFGAGLFTYYWQGLYYFIIWLQHWKSKTFEERQKLIKDYQRFGKYLQDWENKNCSKVLKDTEQQGSKIDIRQVAMREVILYLLFPDYFESILSKGDKEKIIAGFDKEDLRDGSNWTDDKLLLEIRREEEARRLSKLIKNFSFYNREYREKWDDDWNKKQ